MRSEKMYFEVNGLHWCLVCDGLYDRDDQNAFYNAADAVKNALAAMPKERADDFHDGVRLFQQSPYDHDLWRKSGLLAAIVMDCVRACFGPISLATKSFNLIAVSESQSFEGNIGHA